MCHQQIPVTRSLTASILVALLLFAGLAPGARADTGVPGWRQSNLSGCGDPKNSRISTPADTIIPATSPTPFPRMTLQKGDFYFRMDGGQRFVFSRNVTSYQETGFDTILNWTKTGGSKLVRIQLIEGLGFGFGMTKTGAVDESWAQQWEQVFDKAYADGIYVLPVFSSWFGWNSVSGHLWKFNPLNPANGGPATTPAELFQPGSTTQTLWLNWMQALVQRWHTRPNIAGWEIFSELNLVSGASEAKGVSFVNDAASMIRAADPDGRPITASLADFDEWSSLYRSPSIDFINFHPYPASGELDSYIIANVREKLALYHKPVLIGESGLSWQTPDSVPPTLTTAPRAPLGIKHAIWAAMVSGAMNGHALYWEDSYAIYFPTLGFPFVEKYAEAELPAANFARGVNFAGFKPMTVVTSEQVTGAAVGDEGSVVGWFRDAQCEPPDWDLQPVISKQRVTLTVPGAAPHWRVDFYDTATGTTLTSSIATTRQGKTITIALPDFTDDIAFKAYSLGRQRAFLPLLRRQ